MDDLADKKCKACEGWVAPMAPEQASELLRKLDKGWQICESGKKIYKEFCF